MKTSVVFTALIALVAMCSCGKHHAPHHAEHKEHKHTAHHGEHSSRGVESLDVYSDGATLHLLLGEKSDDATVLLHSRSDDGGKTWSPFVRVDSVGKPPRSMHRGMDAQIAAHGNRVVVVWETVGTDKWGGGPMATAISEDGGKTWLPRGNPADDNSTAGHGFIDIAADEKGLFHLVWLDNRDGKQGLRYSRSLNGGNAWERNQTLDAETCECCWNAIATDGAGGVFVLYRDKNPRDMALMISRDHGATWQRAGVVGKFDWQFDGCPHVGGNVAVTRDGKIHAAIWTGIENKSGVYHVVSTDGVVWNEPREIRGKSHRPDIAANSEGAMVLVWDARNEGRSSIWASGSRDNGVTWSEPQRLSSDEMHATHPRVVATSQGFRVFWTENADESKAKWRSAFLPSE
jgi:hypothetical protein